MANTGVKIVLTLKEVSNPGGIPTGNTKPNSMGDADYIPPYEDLSACPVNQLTECPTIVASGSSGSILFEFSLSNATILNPSVAIVRVNAKQGASVIAHIDKPLPNPTGNYFSGTISSLAAGTYDLAIEYVNSGGGTISTCANGATGIGVS